MNLPGQPIIEQVYYVDNSSPQGYFSPFNGSLFGWENDADDGDEDDDDKEEDSKTPRGAL